MNETTKMNWANAEHYEKAFKHLDNQGLDTNNEYYYQELLGSKGLTVFAKDLKNWLKSRGTAIDTAGFEL